MYLCDTGSIILRSGSWTPLDHLAAELHLLVWIVEVYDRQGYPRIAARVASLQRCLTRTHQEPIALAANPDGHALGRPVRHQGGEVREIRPVDERLGLRRQRSGHKYSSSAF